MQSIHVSATTLQRVANVIKRLMPYVVAGILALLGFGSRWIGTRASREDIGDAVGKSVANIKEVESNAHHAATLAEMHAGQLAALWPHVVALEAELCVYRQYSRAASDPNKRGHLIEQARAFYLREYESQLQKHPSDPAEAARLAMLASWSP